jgi:diguanylate cyclase (GGDEF)-like protein
MCHKLRGIRNLVRSDWHLGSGVERKTTQNELSACADELGRRFLSGFEFPTHLEDEFRRYYSRIGAPRARLMPVFALIMTLISIIALYRHSQEWRVFLTVWYSVFFIPLFAMTLYLSTKPDQYRDYQKLLAFSGLVSGIAITSLYYHPRLEDMPSYFAIEVTLILAIWLIVGLRFLPATAVALSISAVHIAGIGVLDHTLQVPGYQIALLFMINGIGAISCYQIEGTTRRSFLESLELAELTKELKTLAEIDPLTGLNNRRTYETYIDRLWRQARRDGTPLTLLLIDIDHFKDYNDHYGHQSGDETLAAVAKVIGAHTNRPFDFAARYGGEEFVLVLHNSDDTFDSRKEEDFAYACAESVRKNVVALQMPHELSESHRYVTVSIGVAFIMPGTNRSLAGALQMADEALYEAKEAGRNRVVVKTDHPAFSTGNFRSEKKRA